MPFRLIYSSEAAPDLDIADLEQMLVESRIRNKARGITGVLIFVEDVFLQILEGEKDSVVDLMHTIERDPRHRGIKIFHERETDERAFASWSMAYLSPGVEAVSRWAQLEGATTIGGVLSSLESEPGRLPGFVIHILKAIAES